MGRLISAEALKKALVEKYDAFFREDGELLYSDHVVTDDDAKDLVKFIDEQPTAYNLDWVMGQLKNNKSSALHDLCRSRGTAYEYANERVYNAWRKAVEIAEKGGIE